VDADAPAMSGAALRGGDAIGEDKAPLPLSKNARTERRPHLACFLRASELGFDAFVRCLHGCRVKYALSSGRNPRYRPSRLSDRCVP